jgi:FG-GAP-like repeat
MKHRGGKLFLILAFFLCACAADPPFEKNEGNNSPEKPGLTDSELASLYGGIYHAVQEEISVEASVAEDIDENSYTSSVRNGVASDLSRAGEIGIFLEEYDITNGKLNPWGGIIEIDIRKPVSENETEDKDESSVSEPDPEITRNEVNREHLYLQYEGDTFIELDAPLCVFSAKYIMAFYTQGTTAPVEYNEVVEYINKDERSGCSFLKSVKISIVYSLERRMPNEEAEVYLLWGDEEQQDNTTTDTDGDRLSDFREINEYFTSPYAADTDGDGYDDLEEIENNFDPNDPGDPSCIDEDGDEHGLFCDEDFDCDDNDAKSWISCETCTDVDGDGYYVFCDSYLTVNGEDCDDESNDSWFDCGICIDEDGDGYGNGCDRGEDCAPSDDAHWSDCGICTDLDGDGFGEGCNYGADCDDNNPNQIIFCFHEPLSYDVIDHPKEVIDHDINNDGFLDLIVMGDSTDTLTILINNHDGTFYSLQNYFVGSDHDIFATEDIDQDGDLDLIVHNQESDILVALEVDNDESLIETELYSGHLNKVYPGDINGDGAVDLLSIYPVASTDYIKILANNGSGAFLPHSEFALECDNFKGVGDLDGDGYSDILTTSDEMSNILCLYFNDGSGNFTNPTTMSVEESPSSIVIDDLDGDGDLDLLIRYMFSLDTFKNNGLGNFTKTTHIGTIFSTIKALKDIDGDADLDLILTDFWSGRVLVNDGECVFTDEGNFATIGLLNDSIFIGDLDGDSDWDKVTVGESLNVWKNNGDDSFSIATGYTTGITSYFNLDAMDIDNDGDLDLLMIVYSENKIVVLENIGNGAFDAQMEYPSVLYPESLISGDFDGDGVLDLLIPSNDYSDFIPDVDARLLKNDGQGRFSETVEVPHISPSNSIATADLDGDGDIDLAATYYKSNNITILLNGGNGDFSSPILVSCQNSITGIIAGDFDGDGDADLTVSRRFSSPKISVFLNNGIAGFSEAYTYSGGWAPSAIVAVDFDNDDDLDLATANETSRSISILINDGDGSFGSVREYDVSYMPFSITSGDYNADGYVDLAIGGIELGILINDGTGGFLEVINYPVSNSYGDYLESIATSDFDDDGDLDLAVTVGGFISLFANIDNATFREAQNILNRDELSAIVTGDMNGDGKSDLIVLDPSAERIFSIANGN